jgi:hemerythrin
MGEKEFFQLDERYFTGIRVIDDQHRELIRFINNFHQRCADDGELAESYFALTIQGFLRYIEGHFAEEERLMERIEYPDIPAHKAQHDVFLKEIFKIVEKCNRGETRNVKHFVRYLSDWLLTHITQIDRKYITWMHIMDKKPDEPRGVPVWTDPFPKMSLSLYRQKRISLHPEIYLG